MANLVFVPIKAEIKSGTYLLYDCACGTGGMLTVAEETLAGIGANRGQQVKCLLYGQEINPETYAFCKADMLLNGEGESADHIVDGAEWSTLSHDAFPAQEFDFDRHAIRACRRAACRLAETEHGYPNGAARLVKTRILDVTDHERIEPFLLGADRVAHDGLRASELDQRVRVGVRRRELDDLDRSTPTPGSRAVALETARCTAPRGSCRRSSGSAAGFRFGADSCCGRYYVKRCRPVSVAPPPPDEIDEQRTERHERVAQGFDLELVTAKCRGEPEDRSDPADHAASKRAIGPRLDGRLC